MARKINRIAGTLIKILKERGFEGRLIEYRVFGRWEKAVGEVIARHAQPHAVHGKKLTLIVDSPAWMQQLSLLKPELVEKVNKSLGKVAIQDIVLRLGEVASTVKSIESVPVRANLNAEDHAKIAQSVQKISDTDTREAIMRVMEKDFLSKKKENRRDES